MRRPPNEDLFESTKMTFGEHLEELRLALFKSLLALVVGFLAGLMLGSSVVDRIQDPLRAALEDHYRTLAERRRQALIEDLKDQQGQVPAWLTTAAADEIPPGVQFERIYLDRDDLVRQLRGLDPATLPSATPPGATPPAAANDRPGQPDQPARISLLVARAAEHDERTQTKSFSVQEPFMVYIKAALVTGIVVSSPLVFFFIWEFVAAGLYPHEKRYVYVFMPFSLALFIAGAAVAFFFALKYVLDFLFSFNAWLNIDPDPRISEWLGFALIMPIAFGISFQLPLVMLFLERIGVFTVHDYLSKWRVAVLVVAILSMLLTPGMDPYSMILMEIPLTLLYFGGILLCQLMPRRTGPLH